MSDVENFIEGSMNKIIKLSNYGEDIEFRDGGKINKNVENTTKRKMAAKNENSI